MNSNAWLIFRKKIGMGGFLTILFGAVALVLAFLLAPEPSGWIHRKLGYSPIAVHLLSAAIGFLISFILILIAALVFGHGDEGEIEPSVRKSQVESHNLFDKQGVRDAMSKTALNFAQAIEQLHVELESEREPNKRNQARAYLSARRKFEYDFLQCGNRLFRMGIIAAVGEEGVLDERDEMQYRLACIVRCLRPKWWKNAEECIALAAHRARILAEKATIHARQFEKRSQQEVSSGT